MQYHIVLSGTRWAQTNEEMKLGKRPRNYIALLQEKLGACIHMPNVEASSADKVRSKLFAGRPENWALARYLANQLTSDDVVFCNAEDSSIPFSAYCVSKKDRPKVVSLFQNFDRPRNRLTARWLRIAKSTDLLVVGSKFQQDLVCRDLNLPKSRVLYLPQFVDTDFFTPGLPSSDKKRPIIASAGLENRDYRLVAAATQDMDLDVKVCDASRFAKRLKKSFPDVVPANMEFRYYEMGELVQLYRDADIFVMSVFESDYHAGSTSLVEAMACKRPIIATATKGLSSYLDPDAILTVRPGDVEGLRNAISYLLNNPDEAKKRAERAYQIVMERHSLEVYASTIAARMRELGGGDRPDKSILTKSAKQPANLA
ncbi:Glycosyl transferases group 1 [Leptolyngbya sp. O-77]|nr:Glycosyl transferases group 1 [Leptolyngbya sp. O-77]